MQVNASQALGQMFLNRASKEVLPPDLGLMLLQELFKVYRFGLVAFRSNPEWDHYRTDSGQVLSIITEFLQLNRDKWMNIFLVFEHDPAFLAIMKEVDMKRYKEVEAEGTLGQAKLSSCGIRELLAPCILYCFWSGVSPCDSFGGVVAIGILHHRP